MRNRNYNASSEIYSLGILFWEMWYGKDAFDDLKGQKMEVFLSSVEGGHRPDLTGITTQTSVMWLASFRAAGKRRPQNEVASQIVSQLSGKF